MSKPSRKRRNPLRPHSSPQQLTPHTSAWFDAILQVDTDKALMTGSIVAHAGRLDVCSICGDAPAPIYDLLDDPFPPVRLCAECLGIRQAMFAESYQPRRTPIDRKP